MEGWSHLGQYLERAVEMAACKGKNMVKTSKRQNPAFKSHKNNVFMLSLYSIQYPWTHLPLQSLITWSNRAFFLLLTSGYPVWPWLSRAVPVTWGLLHFMSWMAWCSAVLLEASASHLASFMCISVMGPQHIPYWLFINPVLHPLFY